MYHKCQYNTNYNTYLSRGYGHWEDGVVTGLTFKGVVAIHFLPMYPIESVSCLEEIRGLAVGGTKTDNFSFFMILVYSGLDPMTILPIITVLPIF